MGLSIMTLPSASASSWGIPRSAPASLGAFRALRVVLVVLCTGLAASGALAGGSLRVLAYIEPPFMNDEGGHREGVALDIAEELFRRTRIAHEIVFVPPKRAYSFAVSDPDTCVLAIERSQEREARLAWIGPFLITRHALYKRKDSPLRVRALDDLSAFRVGAALGSGSSAYLEAMGLEIDQAPANELNLRKLELDRIDLWASDTVSASVLIQERRAAIVMERVFMTTLREMACHPATDPARLQLLRIGLGAMYQDGTIEAIYARYLGPGVKWLDVQ